jgi:protein-arginine kinase activator protein McsA
MGAGSNVDQITQLLIEKTPEDKNIHLLLNDFENETRKEGFITNANLESFRSGKRISFQEYKAVDLFLSGDHYYVHHAYSEADITVETLNNKEYQHCEFVFDDFARTHAKAYVEAYALSKPVMTEMIEEVNASFSIGHMIDQTKKKLSLNKFLSRFKSKVKKLHNLRSEEELIIQVASQTQTIGLVKN